MVKIVIVEEVIEVHELDKGNISASLGKQDKQGKAELSCATLGNKPNKKMSPTKFTYSGRICRFAQFLKAKIKKTRIVNILRNLLKFLGLIYQNDIVLVKIWHIF